MTIVKKPSEATTSPPRMKAHTSLGVTPSGRPCVVKRAFGAGIERLRHEANMLAVARHPNVVECLGFESVTSDGASGFVITTSFAGSQTLDSRDAMTASETAGFFSALATVVDDLHRVGVSHRNLSLEHVIVSPDSRPILCGFGDARSIDISQPGPEFAIDVQADVAALGACLERIINRIIPLTPPGHGRHKSRHLAAHQHAIRILRSTAADCQAEPSIFSNAQELAHRLFTDLPHATMPSALIPASPDSSNPSWETFNSAPPPKLVTPHATRRQSLRQPMSDKRRKSILMGAVAVSAAAAVVVVMVVNPGGSSNASTAPAPVGSPAASPVTSTITAVPNQMTTASPTLLVSATRVEDPSATTASMACAKSGRDCPTVRAPGTVTYQGSTFTLGKPSDTILLADWRCDGVVAPVLFRPSTGAVVIFDTWATSTDVVARPLAKIPNSNKAFVERDDQQCPHLMVATASNITSEINVTGASS